MIRVCTPPPPSCLVLWVRGPKTMSGEREAAGLGAGLGGGGAPSSASSFSAPPSFLSSLPLLCSDPFRPSCSFLLNLFFLHVNVSSTLMPPRGPPPGWGLRDSPGSWERVCGSTLRDPRSAALCERVSLWACESVGLWLPGSVDPWVCVSVNLWVCGFTGPCVRRFVGLWILISRKVWAESLPLMAASPRREENKSDFLLSLSLLYLLSTYYGPSPDVVTGDRAVKRRLQTESALLEPLCSWEGPGRPLYQMPGGPLSQGLICSRALRKEHLMPGEGVAGRRRLRKHKVFGCPWSKCWELLGLLEQERMRGKWFLQGGGHGLSGPRSVPPWP